MKYTGRRRREARREAGCYLRWEGGAGCRVYGVAQSTTAEPRRSLDSAISERAAPLQPLLVLPTPALPLWPRCAKTKAARTGTCV